MFEQLHVTLYLGNAEMQTPEDVAVALRELAARLERDGFAAAPTLRDANGNTVGKWEGEE